jgi:Zn-dependent protease with chaperone function
MRRSTRRGHYGAWRAVCALPTLLGSVLVLGTAFGWLGSWSGLILLGWLLVAAALLSGPIERIAVRLTYRYRPLTSPEAAQLEPLHRHALARCGLPVDAVDWYVNRTMTGVNASATGARSVALSAGLVDALAHGRLSQPQAVAILTHELAHLRDRATRYGLSIAWLGLPWRPAAAIFAKLLRAIVRHVPTARASLVLVPLVGVIAAVQLAQHHAWAALAMLVGLALIVAVEPLAQAAISRASERAADDYTARLGSGPDLAAALQRGQVSDHRAPWLATHPRLADRLGRLQGTTHPR